MSDPTYKSQTLVRYLLGTLPEAEAERLDELSVSDDKFAEALKLAEHDLVDAYAQRELSGVMLEKFKSRYLNSPLGRRQIEFARAFQSWGESNAIERAAHAQSKTRSVEPRQTRTFLRPGLFGFRHFSWGFAIATVLLCVAIGLLALQNLRLRQQINQTQAGHDELLQREQELQRQLETQRNAAQQTEQELAQLRAEQRSQSLTSPYKVAVATPFLTPQLRGAGQVPMLKIESTTKSVAAQLALEPNDFSSYRVSLIEESTHQIVWTSGALTPRQTGDRKTLNVIISANLLKPQNYALRVSGLGQTGNAETISDYPFRVVK